MLTSSSKTAKVIVFTLGLAVFFSAPLTASDDPLNSLEASLGDLVYTVSRSVVTIESSRSVPSSAFGMPAGGALESHVASGLVIDDGLVVAAASSIYGHDRYSVSFDNKTVAASLVGIDYVNEVALLKPAIAVGVSARFSDRRACAGQMVVSLGNSFGLRASPSLGFCAGIRDDGNTQFSIPTGSCGYGGGIFSLGGELLGMIIDNVGQTDRVSVAVPAYRLAEIVDYLKTHGDRRAGFIGVATSEIEVSPAMEFNSSNILTTAGQRPGAMVVDRGLMITQTLPGSPAERSGLVPGDVILAIGNQKVTTSVDLAAIIGRSTPGDRVSFDLVRHNSHLVIPVQIGARISSQPWTDPQAGNRGTVSNRVADSLFQALGRLKDEVSRLESRLNSLH